MNDMRIFWLSVDAVKPYKRNAKRHTDEQVETIAESLRQFGWRQPLVVDRHNVIVAGHGRWAAAKRLKLDSVPCILATDLTDAQIKAYRLVDNRTNESEWDEDLLKLELDDLDMDMGDFGFDIGDEVPEPKDEDGLRSSLQHNVFENQERMQFDTTNYWGIPEMEATQTWSDKFLRFCDYKDFPDLSEYIAHFFYDDYKFIAAWREPDRYLDILRQFNAVVSPNFSLYTDFPRSLQLLSCYRRQWCGAYWQSLGIDVLPNAAWGDRESFDYCFTGIPKHSVVVVSNVGTTNDKDWNGREGERFREGYAEMLKRLEPTKVLFYGTLMDGLEGDIVRIPSYYEQRRRLLAKKKGV